VIPPPRICAQPYLNDDSHRQGGHWPGDTVNGKTRKKYRSTQLRVWMCVSVYVHSQEGRGRLREAALWSTSSVIYHSSQVEEESSLRSVPQTISCLFQECMNRIT